jgi:hypothetical protein
MRVVNVSYDIHVSGLRESHVWTVEFDGPIALTAETRDAAMKAAALFNPNIITASRQKSKPNLIMLTWHKTLG